MQEPVWYVTAQDTQIHPPHQKHRFPPCALQAFSICKYTFIEVPAAICWGAPPLQDLPRAQLPSEVVWLQQVSTPAAPDGALRPVKLGDSKGQFNWTKLQLREAGPASPPISQPAPGAALGNFYAVFNGVFTISL